MKKVISLILALCMLMSVTVFSTAVAEEKPIFHIFAGVTSMSPPNETKPLVKQLNEAAGIDVYWRQ